jgi:hypothetical protein
VSESPDEQPALEHVRGPVSRSVAERRWLGLPPGPFLLCAGFAALGAAGGLFAAGHWPWGLVLLGISAFPLVGLVELTRRQPELTERAELLVADGRSRALSGWQILRERAGGAAERRRTRTQLELLDKEREPILRELGAAAWSGDEDAAARARGRLQKLDERRAQVEHELEERLGESDQRIRLARLPVDETVMVAPNNAGSAGGEAADARREDRGPEGPRGPNAPYPPPDEGAPPTPAQVPEPYPPPDEGTPPTPAPDPGTEPDR